MPCRLILGHRFEKAYHFFAEQKRGRSGDANIAKTIKILLLKASQQLEQPPSKRSVAGSSPAGSVDKIRLPEILDKTFISRIHCFYLGFRGRFGEGAFRV